MGTRGAVEQAESELSPDEIFTTLSNRRRRHVLYFLRYVEETATIRDLSEQLAAWENGTTAAAVVPRERKRLYTALHQTHLPKMDDLGVVVYDRNRGTVQATDSVRKFDAYLNEESTGDRAWSRVYLAVGCVLGLMAAAGAAGVAPVTSVGGYWYALLAAVAVVGIAAVHAVRESRRSDVSEELSPPPASPGVAADD
jgi:hypothetical protein